MRKCANDSIASCTGIPQCVRRLLTNSGRGMKRWHNRFSWRNRVIRFACQCEFEQFKKRFLYEGTLESINWNRFMASINGCFKRFIWTEKYRLRTIIDQFCRTGVDVGFQSRSYAKQDEKQIVCRMFSFILSHERELQCSMEALNHPIGRGMVRSCADSLASKKLAHLLKKSWF